MNDEDKTKEQLIEELTALRRQVTELKTFESEQKRAAEMLQESEEKYRSLVESTEDSIYLVDRKCTYLFMNKKHISRSGMKEGFYGRSYGEFHSPEEAAEFSKQIDTVFNTGKSIQHEHRSQRDGRYFLRTLSPVRRSGEMIIAVTVISKDITALKKMEERLQTLSFTDELTGLYNRRGFFNLVEQQLKLSKRMKKGIFMLYADLDGLKEINDTLGHSEGDVALVAAARILRNTYRESDIVARIGGDEFVVIPVGTTGDDVEKITRRLQDTLSLHNKKHIRKFKLSLSTGVAYYDPASPCSVDDLLVQGDRSMYLQKRNKQKVII
ncbi:MAG TPA: GGDEF domain-containing protein [Thermodesulfovibrionales bacterium]|nr:GGDEF domain-containing protein [Thermodesulfovibrionales bacterium]